MATKTQRAKAAAAKKGPNPKRRRKLAQRKAHHERGEVENRKAGRKAIFALESDKGKRRSRKSTRRSANRGRGDTALIRRAENAVSSSDARARRARAAR
jgi:hypothetical protein